MRCSWPSEKDPKATLGKMLHSLHDAEAQRVDHGDTSTGAAARPARAILFPGIRSHLCDGVWPEEFGWNFGVLLRYLLKFRTLLSLFVLVAYAVVFFEEAQSIGEDMKPKIGIAAPVGNERVCIFDVKSDANMLPKAFDFYEVFRCDSSANGNVDYLRSIWV